VGFGNEGAKNFFQEGKLGRKGLKKRLFFTKRWFQKTSLDY